MPDMIYLMIRKSTLSYISVYHVQVIGSLAVIQRLCFLVDRSGLRPQDRLVSLSESTWQTNPMASSTAGTPSFYTRSIIPTPGGTPNLHADTNATIYNLCYNTSRPAGDPSDWHVLEDGSLITSPLTSDVRSTVVQLALISALGMFFLNNSVTVVRYICRGKVRKKLLFHMLLASQLIGLLTICVTMVPFFVQSVSCTGSVANGKLGYILYVKQVLICSRIGRVEVISTFLSRSLLVSRLRSPFLS